MIVKLRFHLLQSNMSLLFFNGHILFIQVIYSSQQVSLTIFYQIIFNTQTLLHVIVIMIRYLVHIHKHTYLFLERRKKIISKYGMQKLELFPFTNGCSSLNTITYCVGSGHYLNCDVKKHCLNINRLNYI